ncbi:MAG: hypothetical protein ACOCT9_02975 [archaeon]
MAKKKTNVTKLAKNSNSKKSNTTKKVNENNNNSNNDIDVKAKERVNTLLDDVNLTLKDNESNVLELNKNNIESLEWLQDQIKSLSEENEKLKNEKEEAKTNYKKLHSQYKELIDSGGDKKQEKELIPDSMLKNGITELFTEFQKNFLGQNPEKTRYSEIKLKHLMTKMVNKFPFLKEKKRLV